MLKAIFCLSIFGFLSGCTRNIVTADNINPNNVYQGYPCFDSCQAFREGYNSARTKSFTGLSDCKKVDKSQQLGCMAFLNDLEFQTTDNGGFQFSP